MLVTLVVRQLAGRFTYLPKSSIYTSQCYKATLAAGKELRINDQMQYVNTIVRDSNTSHDWSSVKSSILSKRGSIHSKSVDAVLLKSLVSASKYDTAKSLVQYLKRTKDDLGLGTINSILLLYYQLGLENELSANDIEFIRNTYTSLYDKYKMLDAITCERLVHSLAIIGDWKDSMKVLRDINVTSVPSHSAYSVVVSSLFKHNEKEEAINVIRQSLEDCRPLLDVAYEGWIQYVVRNSGDDKERVTEGMEEINNFISQNCVRISKNVADMMYEVYASSLQWQANHSVVSNISGKCHSCKTILKNISLTSEEFTLLQSTFKDRVLVGKDVFLKTSPEELSDFLKFIEKSEPYDIVLDALNIAFALPNAPKKIRLWFLNSVVTYFLERNKTVLVLGRKHMLSWPKKEMNFLLHNTKHFFTNDLSQDDPFFLTAAIFSGAKTDILSRDKLRGHRFLLKDTTLRSIFLRWQWEHQWTYSTKNLNVPVISKPVKITPCAQKGLGWHFPYELESSVFQEDPMNASSPMPSNWLCVQPARAPVQK